VSVPPFIHRVRIRHFKSIARCDVTLSPLTLLVGPNGAGKSNFLDALCFVRDGLRESLEYAVRNRGGIQEVRRRSGGHPTHLALRLEFKLGNAFGHYAFELGAQEKGGFKVAREQCELHDGGRLSFFDVLEGTLRRSSLVPAPPATRDRLYLVNAAGVPAFRPLYDALSTMGFYNLNPRVMGDLQEPDEGALLDKFGRNLASVIARMERDDPQTKARITEYLRRVAPSVHAFDFKALGPKHSLEFRQDVTGQKNAWRFHAAAMSDGTLRALGVLTAVFQGKGQSVPLVGIEEPETALHPAAAGVLLDSLREASLTTQVIVTTHSGDLLDREDIDPEAIRAVVNENGNTVIGEVDDSARHTLKDSLFTAGELLRLNQLSPNPRVFTETTGQIPLFSGD
jgi:predicted ATPase